MALESQVVAERGAHVTRVASVHEDAAGLKPLGEGRRQHAIRLLGLAVGLVVVAPSLKLQVGEVEIARPVAGDVYHTGRGRPLQMFGERPDHPDVAKHVGGELQLDSLGRFLTSVGRDGRIVDQDMQRPTPPLGQGVDGCLPRDVHQFKSDARVSGRLDDLADGLHGLLFVATGEDDLGIRPSGNLPCDSLADGPGGAGDQAKADAAVSHGCPTRRRRSPARRALLR